MYEGRNLVQVWVRSTGSTTVDAFLSSAEFALGSPTGSWFLLTSEAGEPIGNGQQIFMSDATSTVSSAANPIYLRAQLDSPTNKLRLIVRPEYGGVLEARLYPHAKLFHSNYSETPGFAPMLELMAGRGAQPSCLEASGSYRILEIAYAPDGSVQKLAADAEERCNYGPAAYAAVRLNSATPLFNVVSFGANTPSTVANGTPIQWRAVASSGTGRVEYKYWLHNHAANIWSVLRDWSTDETADWTASNPGLYHVQVWARTVGRSVDYEDWRMFELNVAAAAPTAYSVIATGETRADHTVTLRAAAGGGSGSLEYRFWALDRATGLWTMLRDYAPDPTFDWNVPIGGAGDYTLQVWVRQIGSTGRPDTFVAGDVTILPARSVAFRGTPGETRLDNATLRFTSPETLINSGSSLASDQGALLIAQPTPGVGLPAPDGTWTIWFWNSSAAVMPGHYYPAGSDFPSPVGLRLLRAGRPDCAATGAFTLHEYTRTIPEVVGSTQVLIDRLALDFEQKCNGSSATLYGGIRWNSNVDSIALTAIKVPTTITPGNAVTVEAVGSAMTDPVEFRFWAYNHGTGVWTMLRDYAAAPTINWSPAAGSYTIQVWMRKIGSGASYDRWLNSAAVTVQ